MRVSFTAHTTLLCASTSVHLHHGNDFENNVFFRMSFVLYSFLTSHSAHFAVIILPFFSSLVSAFFFAFWQKKEIIVEREKWSIPQHLKLKRVSGTREDDGEKPPQHTSTAFMCGLVSCAPPTFNSSVFACAEGHGSCRLHYNSHEMGIPFSGIFHPLSTSSLRTLHFNYTRLG